MSTCKRERIPKKGFRGRVLKKVGVLELITVWCWQTLTRICNLSWSLSQSVFVFSELIKTVDSGIWISLADYYLSGIISEHTGPKKLVFDFRWPTNIDSLSPQCGQSDLSDLTVHFASRGLCLHSQLHLTSARRDFLSSPLAEVLFKRLNLLPSSGHILSFFFF